MEPDEADLDGKSLQELRSLALAAAATPKVPSKESQRTYYIRSVKVKAYVLKRANGHCEACKKAAPFVRKDGTPIWSHITLREWQINGGPDHPGPLVQFVRHATGLFITGLRGRN